MDYSAEQYLKFPSPRSGKLQVDDTSRVGNVQQLFQALLDTDYTTWNTRKMSFLVWRHRN